MKKGIVLIAIGGESYLRWAVNMACSIKYHSPDLAIQLICSNELYSSAVTAPKLFDIITKIEDERWQNESGLIFPAKLKTSFYDLIEFDEAIYLDVDGCILKDITTLFNQKSDLVSDVQGIYDTSQGELFNHLKWAKPKEIWQHFNLKQSDKLPAINSSFLFIRKGETSKKVFNVAHELLMNNPLPYDKHWYVWGRKRDTKVSQPDELYFNVAMAKLGIIPANEVAIYFRMINDICEYTLYSEVAKNYYGIGLFGQLETNHRRCRNMYNAAMREMWIELTGYPFNDNCEKLSQTKFAVL